MALHPKVRLPASARPHAAAYASGQAGSSPPSQKARLPRMNTKLFRQHHAAFKNRVTLDEPPAQYDPDKQYIVQLKHAVQVPTAGVWLRPTHEVVVSGAFAATIADNISGAKVV